MVLLPVQPHLGDIETLRNVKDILTLAGNPRAAVVVSGLVCKVAGISKPSMP